MADPGLFGEQELGFLSALIDEEVSFLLVGLSAAALQGAPVVTQDVDLWFEDPGDPGIRKALKRVGGTYVPPSGDRPPMFAGGGARLFDVVVHMHGIGDFEEEMKEARHIQVGGVTVPVLPLERIIVSKEATNRPKDLLALPVLRDAADARRSDSRR